MSVTDQYVENDVIYRVLENGQAVAAETCITSMFSPAEILAAMNRIQQKFLLETGMIVTRAAPIVGTVGQERYALPVDSIRPRRVTWTSVSNSGGGTSTPYGSGGYGAGGYGGAATPTQTISTLTQCDTWELDNGSIGWPSNQANPPLAWWENTLEQQLIGIGPAPADEGALNVMYIALAATLDGTDVAFAVPDDWTPYITWGTLGELLSSDGPSFDPLRAQYCSRRLDEGIELANLVLGGGQ